MGRTLTTAVNGLAAVRGQNSVQILYEQSIAGNIRNPQTNTVLFDPTVQKQVSLNALVATNGFPASILTDPYNGFLYFPKLPPNLISRVCYDPNTTNLYFKGEFVTDVVNGNYVMLNVLAGDDALAVNSLCTNSDHAYKAWTNAVAHLSTPEYTFGLNTNGQYSIDPTLTLNRDARTLVEVTSSDTAVDSYAMSAVGPGQGYVTYWGGERSRSEVFH